MFFESNSFKFEVDSDIRNFYLTQEKNGRRRTETEQWKNYVKKNENLFKNLLQQSLITYTPIKYNNKIDYRKIIVDLGNRNIDIKISGHTNGNNKVINSITYPILE